MSAKPDRWIAETPQTMTIKNKKAVCEDTNSGNKLDSPDYATLVTLFACGAKR
jgi:hypothetical protein